MYEDLVRYARVALGAGVGPNDAEDVVQDAYVKLFARPRRLRDRAGAEGYLRSSVVNAARKHVGRIARRRESAYEWSDMAQLSAHVPAPNIDDAMGWLSALPKRQREVLGLRVVLDQSEATTAELLGISVGAVKSYLHKAISTLTSIAGGEST